MFINANFSVINGDTQLTISDFGARIISLKVKGKEMALGYDDLSDYAKHDGYLGTTIGRVANRIENGTFLFKGKRCHLYKETPIGFYSRLGI